MNQVKDDTNTTDEIAAWKEKNVLIDRNGDDALVMRKMDDGRREFVVAHGGTISVDSAPGKGSAFAFTFPK